MTLRHVARTLFPRAADIQDGPPVARIVQFAGAMMCLALVSAFFLGLPAASDAVVPLFIPPIFLLWSRQRAAVVTGFLSLSLACVARAVSVAFIPHLDAGQAFSGMIVWATMAFVWGPVFGRAALARGVR